MRLLTVSGEVFQPVRINLLNLREGSDAFAGSDPTNVTYQMYLLVKAQVLEEIIYKTCKEKKTLEVFLPKEVTHTNISPILNSEGKKKKAGQILRLAVLTRFSSERFLNF